MSHRKLVGRSAYGLPAVILLAVATSGHTFAASSQQQGQNAPLVIESEGSFAFAGKVETDATGQSRHCDHGYADFSLPVGARKVPIVMWHSTSVKTWTSDPPFLGGHQNFQDIFLRRKWPVYIIDLPRQGRANYGCFALDYVSNWPQVGRDQRTFAGAVAWRLGTWVPPGPPTFFNPSQFPDDPTGALLDQTLRARYPDNEQLPDAFPLEADSVSKLLEQIGASILFTHSGSGYPGWLTAIKSPKVLSVVSFEPGYLWPEGEVPPGQTRVVPLADFLKLTKIPIEIIIGDRYPAASLAIAKAFVDTVNKHGGNAKLIYLPDLGMFGNSHIMMMEKNNVQVADVVSQFLNENGLDKH